MVEENVAVPSDRDESMRRTLRILQDEEAMEVLERSGKDIEEGRVQTLDEVRAELD